MRRKLFEARKLAPDDVDVALRLILDVYRVEHDAREAGIVGTAEHLALRQARARRNRPSSTVFSPSLT